MLTETYRPKTLDEIAGQEKAVKLLQNWPRIADRGALIFEGESGNGKTSAALALARSLGVDPDGPDFHKVNAGACRREAVQQIGRDMRLAAWSRGGWRVWLIDEADTMSREARNAMMGLLEELPSQRLIILTTNRADELKADKAFASRLLWVHFVKPHIDAIVPLLKRIAADVTGDGASLPYERIIRDARSNVRAAIQALEAELLSV